jgi:hypothetical protein
VCESVAVVSRAFEIIQRLHASFPPELFKVARQMQKVASISEQMARLYGPTPRALTPVKPTRKVAADLPIPEEFWKIFKEIYGTEEQCLRQELTRRFYSLERCAMREFLKLRRENSESEALDQDVLWENISTVHEKLFGCRPTHPTRLFRRLGLLEALRRPPRGRPPRK